MEERFDQILHGISLGTEVMGVAIIVLGAGFSLFVFIQQLYKEGDWAKNYHTFRTTFARAILLGLEFLVAGDIIGTVAIKPNLQNLYVLGLIVLIRTFLSFALEIEITGQLPWKISNKKDLA